jgi:TolB-like protein
MIYRFGPFELDTDRFELRTGGKGVAVEPQVLALIAYLIEHRDRLVTRDELIEKIWYGRVVSDEAVASRVKFARQALGDDGRSQRFIRTIRRRGLRFVAEVAVAAGAPVAYAGAEALASAREQPPLAAPSGVSRPSIAVLPFTWVGDPGEHAPLAYGIAQELITELSHLHWLFVIARGSSFRFSALEVSYAEVGRLLGARYCLTGTMEPVKGRLGISVELVDTRDAMVVWAERLEGQVADVHALRAEIRARILSALEIRISLHEAARVRGAGLEDLDAWSAYHRGLRHMYRFNQADNAAARALFERSVSLDSGFARAHAGLSFLHFQKAFLHHTDDIKGEIHAARAAAERGLELDSLDPFVNFTMGRTFWLEGDLDSSRIWLERATSINPNYAEGVYARAWTEVLGNRVSDGRQHVDLAMRLSPLDPLYYAMLAVRALTHLANGEDAEAVRWAEQAARSPGAHVFIAMIAMIVNAVRGESARASEWATIVRERNPALTGAHFLRSFPMEPGPMRSRVSQALGRLGF